MNKDSENIFSNEDPEISAPLLFNLKSKLTSGTGFSTPDGYFDSLPAEVMKKIESIPDFESQAIVNPFKTPDGYFDSLPTIIQQRIVDQNKKKKTAIAWMAEVFNNPAPKYAVVLVSLFLVIFFSVKYFTRTIKVDYVQEAPATEPLESFYLSQLDETVLSEYAEETLISEDVQENAIENYLLENDVDLILISENL